MLLPVLSKAKPFVAILFCFATAILSGILLSEFPTMARSPALFDAFASSTNSIPTNLSIRGNTIGDGSFESGKLAVLAANPYGYWGSSGSRFGGKVNLTQDDSHSGKYALTVSNNETTASYVYQYVSMNTNSYTLSFWYKATSGSVQVELANGWGPPPWFLGGPYNPMPGVSIAPWSNTSSYFPTDGSWHHAVAVNTPATQSLYLDGRPVFCQAGSSIVPSVLLIGDLTTQNAIGKYLVDDVSVTPNLQPGPTCEVPSHNHRIHTVARGDVLISQPAYDNSEGGRRIITIDDHTFVAFYYNESSILYKVSANKGQSWGKVQSADTGVVGSDYLRWTVASTQEQGNIQIILLYSNAVFNNTMTQLHAKQGVFSYNDGSIKWQNKPSTLNTVTNPDSCSTNIGGGACTAAVASSDARGDIFAAFRWASNGTGYKYAIYESSDGGISWNTSMNATWAISPGTRGEMSLASMSLGGMLFVYAPLEANELYYSVYHAGSWSNFQVTNGTGLQGGTVKQLSAISDSNHFVNVFYPRDGNSGDLMVARWNNMGVFKGAEVIDSSLSHSLPSASITSNGVIHVFTLADDKIYEITNSGGHWTIPANPFGSKFRNPDELTSAESAPAAIWREDVMPSHNKFAIRFGD